MKNKQIFRAILLSIVFFSTIASANIVIKEKTDAELQKEKTLLAEDIQRFNKAFQIVKHYYVEPVSDDKLLEDATRGMVDTLDPHSNYLDSDDLKDLRNMTSGEFSGLGIEVLLQDDVLKVVTPLDGGPAQKAGIKAGDLVMRIDGTLVKGMKLREAIKKMRGKKGTAIVLTVIRKGEQKPLQIKIVRDDIHVPSIKSRLLEPGVAYVRISNFQANTNDDLVKTINTLSKSSNTPIKGLILDLRNNPGGLLDSATAVTNDFLDSAKLKNKLIVYTKGRADGSQTQLKATGSDMLHGAPIVVLINEGSASGAEIVAGALQDQKRAVIAGTKSFGKGSVQTVIPIDNNTAVKITTALYYTPAGRSIQASGILPDVNVEDLKISPINKETDAENFVTEADLKGHLKNGNAKRQILDIPSETPTPTELATTDYQAFVALNLLKGLMALQVRQ